MESLLNNISVGLLQCCRLAVGEEGERLKEGSGGNNREQRSDHFRTKPNAKQQKSRNIKYFSIIPLLPSIVVIIYLKMSIFSLSNDGFG